MHDPSSGLACEFTPSSSRQPACRVDHIRSLNSESGAVRALPPCVCDPRDGWDAECERRFGSHPVQICHEWNTSAHLADYEGGPTRRALTRAEVQSLFDHADAHVAEIRRSRRKGWLAAF